MNNTQQFVWSILYSFYYYVSSSCELRSIKYVVERSKGFDLVNFYLRMKTMICTTQSFQADATGLDSIWVPLKELTQVLASIYQKLLVKKTHLLTLLQTRSKNDGIMAGDICAILVVDFVKCRDKIPQSSTQDDIIGQAGRTSSPLPNKAKTKTDTQHSPIKDTMGSVKKTEVSKSKSILKKSDEKLQKTGGRSLTPTKKSDTKKVTINLKETQVTYKEQMRSTLGEITLNEMTPKKLTYGRVVSKKKPGQSVFLEEERKEQQSVKAASLVKDEFVFHLNESIPRYEEYQRQLREKNTKTKKVDIFKDKRAML